jgi:hypothetical protein
MTQDLHEMTSAQLKQYISVHRNEDEAFRAALQVLMDRRDPNAPSYSCPTDFSDPESQVQVQAILLEKLKQIESERSDPGE